MYEFAIVLSYMSMLAMSIWVVLYYGQVNREKMEDVDVEDDDTKIRYNLRNIPRVNYREESSDEEWEDDDWEDEECEEEEYKNEKWENKTWELLQKTDDESREKLISGLNALSDRRGRTISEIVEEVLG
jgi:hypothetical protein